MTSGLSTIDYFLSGAAMEPAGAEQHYSESLVKLPNLGIHYSPHYFEEGRTFAAAVPWAEALLGDREGRVFYWSCQALHKYRPGDDDLYPTIAESVPNALFGFVVPSPFRAIFEKRLAAAFAARGLRHEDFCRLLPLMGGEQFAAVSSLADVFLDTLGWSGGNTTLENLAFDTPLVTVAGRFMRGRHTAAILDVVGLGSWVSQDKADYIKRAVALADTTKRTEARQTLKSAKAVVYDDMSAVHALRDFLLSSPRGV